MVDGKKIKDGRKNIFSSIQCLKNVWVFCERTQKQWNIASSLLIFFHHVPLGACIPIISIAENTHNHNLFLIYKNLSTKIYLYIRTEFRRNHKSVLVTNIPKVWFKMNDFK